MGAWDFKAAGLSPEIGYLVVLSAVWSSGIALATPGTGILEMIALVNLVLAVLSLFLLQANILAVSILIIGALVLAIEAIRPRRGVFILVSAVLLSVGSVFLFGSSSGEPAGVPIWLAIFGGVLTACGFGFVIRKMSQLRHIPPAVNPDMLIGRQGIAKTAIGMDGLVQVASELWSARADCPIPAGTRVRVVERHGLILQVEQESK
jgi:membrane-bound serine protease (ClpP class)